MQNPIKKKVMELILENGYPINQNIIRRLDKYTYQSNTIIMLNRDKIILSTEYKIKGVHHVLIINSDGTLDWAFQFDKG